MKTCNPSRRASARCWPKAPTCYLMFKHEDTPDGALNAEKLPRKLAE
jgi:hypothetical protein